MLGNKARALSFRILPLVARGKHNPGCRCQSEALTRELKRRNQDGPQGMRGLVETEVRESADSGPDLGGLGGFEWFGATLTVVLETTCLLANRQSVNAFHGASAIVALRAITQGRL
jgi:hypothetical protein